MSEKKIEDPNIHGTVDWLPSLLELTDRGILYQEWDQLPGDLSYTGPGTPHWVLNPVSVIISFHLL
jgi:hypothetical protein